MGRRPIAEIQTLVTSDTDGLEDFVDRLLTEDTDDEETATTDHDADTAQRPLSAPRPHHVLVRLQVSWPTRAGITALALCHLVLVTAVVRSAVLSDGMHDVGWAKWVFVPAIPIANLATATAYGGRRFGKTAVITWIGPPFIVGWTTLFALMAELPEGPAGHPGERPDDPGLTRVGRALRGSQRFARSPVHRSDLARCCRRAQPVGGCRVRSAGPPRPAKEPRPVSALIPPPRTACGLLPVQELTRVEDGEELHAVLWSAGPGWRMISSAVLGGGIGERGWVLNAQVAHGYRRTDPGRHLAEVAGAAGAPGTGVGMMTAADVSAYTRAHDGGAEAVATGGVTVRGWAASPAEGTSVATEPGTINIIAALPVALSDAALVNAVATATEAKVQALLDAGYDCSGTPTDAVCIAARTPHPGDQVHAFAGPRSLWGARLARAVHRAVREAVPAP